MNEDVYNYKVASYKQKLNDLEKNILNGTINIETKKDFEEFFINVKDLFEEGKKIYKNLVNPVSMANYELYLQNENEFMILLKSLLDILNKYHKNISFVSKEELHEEWFNLKIIINYNKIKKKLANIIKLLSNPRTENIGLHEGFLALEKELEYTESEANDAGEYFYSKSNDYHEKLIGCSIESLEAIDYLIDKVDTLSNKEFYEKVLSEPIKENDIKVDETYLETLNPVTAKIDYLKMVLGNIEGLPGRKVSVKYKGKEKRISKYKSNVSNWLNCQNLIDKYEIQYKNEIDALTKDEIDNESKETYAKLYLGLNEVDDKMYALGEEAQKVKNTNQVVTVTTINKSPFYVRKDKLNVFNNIFVMSKRLQNEKKAFSEKHNIEEINSEDDYTKLQAWKRNIFDRLNFLKDKSDSEQEVANLKQDLTKVKKSENLAIFANIQILLKKLNISDEEKKLFSKVFEKPEEFIKSGIYNLSAKKAILSKIISTYPSEVKSKIENELYNTLGNPKEEIKTTRAIKKENRIKAVLEKQISRVRRAFNTLPKKLENVKKIINLKEPINSKKIALGVYSTAAVSAAFVGINVLLNNSNGLDHTNAFGIENSVDDTFSSNSSIRNVKEAVKKETKQAVNVVSSYFNEENSTIYDLNNIFSLKDSNQALSNNNQTNLEINEIEKEKENEKESNIDNKDYHNFGDRFMAKDSEVFMKADDALKKENAYKPYFGNETYRTIEGISYEYNGEVITIFSDEPDAEAKKVALENNGAVEISYVSSNENSSELGYEGFFAEDNVVFENEIEGRTM